MKAWTKAWLEWVKAQVHFEEPALEAALGDYFHEAEHVAARIGRLEKALDEAIGKAPEQIRAVIEALQALRGVAQLTAATIVSEIGSFSRFEPRKLMGYSGLVTSERSSGNRLRRGSITKTGNSHLRRVIVEAAWAYQRRPWIGGYLLMRQRDLNLSAEVQEIAWKASTVCTNAIANSPAQGKNQKSNRRRGRTGTAGLHLGYCGPHRTPSTAITGGLTAARRKNPARKKAKRQHRQQKQRRWQRMGTRKGESS